MVIVDNKLIFLKTSPFLHIYLNIKFKINQVKHKKVLKIDFCYISTIE